MPGPESRTATRTPHVSLRSVLSNNSRTPSVDRAHGFHRVQDQVQHDLLHLNTIALDGRQALGKRVCTETPFLAIALRANPITSSIASLRSK